MGRKKKIKELDLLPDGLDISMFDEKSEIDDDGIEYSEFIYNNFRFARRRITGADGIKSDSYVIPIVDGEAMARLKVKTENGVLHILNAIDKYVIDGSKNV